MAYLWVRTQSSETTWNSGKLKNVMWTMLASFMFTRHKVESFQKREPQSGKYSNKIGLKASLWHVYLIADDAGRSSSQWAVLLVPGAIRKQTEQSKRNKPLSSAPACSLLMFLPWLPLVTGYFLKVWDNINHILLPRLLLIMAFNHSIKTLTRNGLCEYALKFYSDIQHETNDSEAHSEVFIKTQ